MKNEGQTINHQLLISFVGGGVNALIINQFTRLIQSL